jgi:hypothetical protein
LLKVPGCCTVRRFHKDEAGKRVGVVGNGRSVAVMQGPKGPMLIAGWDREIAPANLFELEPDWRRDFPYTMPDDPQATTLAVVINARGRTIVDEAVRQYVYPGVTPHASVPPQEFGRRLDQACAGEDFWA